MFYDVLTSKNCHQLYNQNFNQCQSFFFFCFLSFVTTFNLKFLEIIVFFFFLEVMKRLYSLNLLHRKEQSFFAYTKLCPKRDNKMKMYFSRLDLNDGKVENKICTIKTIINQPCVRKEYPLFQLMKFREFSTQQEKEKVDEQEGNTEAAKNPTSTGQDEIKIEQNVEDGAKIQNFEKVWIQSNKKTTSKGSYFSRVIAFVTKNRSNGDTDKQEEDNSNQAQTASSDQSESILESERQALFFFFFFFLQRK
ncbi:hypothetical protein RFI_31511 [Reticulomyxa filosa]|uniref:Transmembrane protein n=1 Tax=Reticulomyxa filosa TaxID=46433 RepID=X6LX35_RETFI|nr:hypothetical protein RFI_31511 [Reticulomyxa filosa]|eukprot:ETO05886.1 hypothetical protein RFI_31511 [Reticulomyxa filosa]